MRKTVTTFLHFNTAAVEECLNWTAVFCYDRLPCNCYGILVWKCSV